MITLPRYNLLIRYALLIIMLFCSFYTYAQKDYSKEINEVLEKQDINAGKKLIKKIKPEDISLLADRNLTYYYYLKAFVEKENNDNEAAMKSLLIVQNLIETKVGIYNERFIYVEILNALGEISEDCGKVDDALLYYEEGLVKSLAFWSMEDETMQDLLKSLRNNASVIFKKQGHDEMAHFLAMEKPLDYEGTFDQADDMLSEAIKLKNEGEPEKALKLLDQAKDIFSKCGEQGAEMMQPLHRIYLYCYAAKGDTENIDKLLKTKKKLIFYDGAKSYLASDMAVIIATFLLTHHDLKTAKKYYNFLTREYDKSTPEDVAKVNEYKNTLDFFEREYSLIDSLTQKRNSYIEKNYDWGVTSLLLANEYIRIRDYSIANNLCQEVYAVSSKLDNDPQGLHNAVLQNLADYNMQEALDFKLAERYLKEQLLVYDKFNVPQNSEARGWVYNKLAIVYMRSEQYKLGDEAIAKAENILVPIYTKESETYTTILHNRGRLAQLQGKLDLARQLFTQSNELRIRVVGAPLERTIQYLNEVEQAIKEKL